MHCINRAKKGMEEIEVNCQSDFLHVKFMQYYLKKDCGFLNIYDAIPML